MEKAAGGAGFGRGQQCCFRSVKFERLDLVKIRRLEKSRIWERGPHGRSAFGSRPHINDEEVRGLDEITKGVRVDGEKKRSKTELGTPTLSLQGEVEKAIKRTRKE